ncbi:MAG: ABC transporter ATP-binding protein [Mangrovicoccus sp.]
MGLALKLRDLRVEGRGGRLILSAAALDIAPGEAVVIKGPSGAGKSTLLYALAGLIRPASGQILWGDMDLAKQREAALAAFRRRSVGFIFQDHLLFEELSSLGNAAVAAGFAPRSERAGLIQGARSMLERLGLGDKTEQRSATQSGGERQRVAVARALAGAPPVILADEPTASLDRASADRLIEDLLRLAREDGRTLIAVTHDTAFHARAARVIEVVDGVLQPEGVHV